MTEQTPSHKSGFVVLKGRNPVSSEISDFTPCAHA